MKTISVTPSSNVLGLLQNMNYTPWFAIGEFVDNSISSFERWIKTYPDDVRFDNLRIDVRWDEEAQTLTVTDNAAGIPIGANGWERALELGSPNPDPSFLSVYGYGMKAAAFWLSPRLSITSKVAGENVQRRVSIDVHEVADEALTEVPLEETPNTNLDDHWTVITLSGLNPGRSFPTGRTLGKVRNYLASMYRAYIREDSKFVHPRTNKPFVSITVQNQTLTPIELELLEEPFWPTPVPPPPSAEKIYWRKEINFEVPNNREPDALPFRVSGWAGVLRTMSADSGLFLMFRGKGLLGIGQGSQTEPQDTYKPVKIFGPANGWRARRIVAELDVSDFSKLNTSDGVKFSDVEKEAFEDELLKALHECGVWTMATNFRPHAESDFSPSELKKLQDALNKSIDFAASNVNAFDDLTASNMSKTSLKVETDNDHMQAERVLLDKSGRQIMFSVDFKNTESPLLSIYKQDSGSAEIVVNMSHPFVQKYFTIPKNDPGGFFEVAIEICLAELEQPDLYPVRARLNQRFEKYFKELSLLIESED